MDLKAEAVKDLIALQALGGGAPRPELGWSESDDGPFKPAQGGSQELSDGLSIAEE